MTTRPQMSGKAAAEEVLRKARGPLHIKEITERVLAGYRTGLKGTTPQATLGAQLHVAAHRKDTFKKVAPGTFDLIDRAAKKRAAPAAAAQAKTDFKAPSAKKTTRRRVAARR